MPLQTVMDSIANIVGGPLMTGRVGIYSGAGLIAGGNTVKFAYSLLPDETALGEDGLVHVCAWGGTQVDPAGGGGDLTTFRHRIRNQLLLSMSRSQLPNALAILTPFVEVYRDLFAAHVKLNGSCASSRIVEFLDPIAADPLYVNRIAIECVLEVTEKTSLTFAA